MCIYLFFFAVQKDSGLCKIDIQISRVLQIIPPNFSPIILRHVYYHYFFFLIIIREKSFLSFTNYLSPRFTVHQFSIHALTFCRVNLIPIHKLNAFSNRPSYFP